VPEERGLFVPGVEEIKEKLLPELARLLSQLLTDHKITITIERKS